MGWAGWGSCEGCEYQLRRADGGLGDMNGARRGRRGFVSCRDRIRAGVWEEQTPEVTHGSPNGNLKQAETRSAIALSHSSSSSTHGAPHANTDALASPGGNAGAGGSSERARVRRRLKLEQTVGWPSVSSGLALMQVRARVGRGCG